MTSKSQAIVNQRNAQFSTGPVTNESISMASHNGMKHGLLSQLKVLPGLERQEDWDAHYGHTLQNLVPIGYMETVLAERVALLLWRLGRVARYERECAAVELEQVDARLSDRWIPFGEPSEESPIQEMEVNIREAQQMIDFVDRLTDSADADQVESVFAAQLLDELAEFLNVDIYGQEADLTLPDYPDGADPSEVEWTCGRLRGCLVAVAGYAEVSFEEALHEIAETYRLQLANAQTKLQHLNCKRDQYQRLRIVPDEDRIAKITRYEAHLERCLWRTMHELQRLQAARVNKSAPTPIAIDVTMTAGDEAA